MSNARMRRDPGAGPGRRTVLGAVAAATVLGAQQAVPIPVIDTHFHLYDQTRPQGAPFPFTPNAPPFLPRHFRETAVPLGIVGGIEVEASPWLEDNLWVLMQIESEPLIVGTVGNLDPRKPDFGEYLERFHRNKLFLGIRYGNIWKGHDLVAAVEEPEFVANMKLFAQTGLTLEVANPRLDLVEATLRLADKVPTLRIVLGHLQALALPASADSLRRYSSHLEQLRKGDVYAKVSGLHRARTGGGEAPPDAAVYLPVMDFLWDRFGADRLVYAGRNAAALEILKTYFLAKGRPAAEKFFWRNSIAAFRWVRRDPGQPSLSD